MKLLTALETLVLALLVASCESRWTASPTNPTLIPSPAATPERWKLTMTITSVTGPRVDCFSPVGWGTIGTTIRDLPPLMITRSAESITIDVPDPWYDGNRYVGSVAGDNFTATSGSYDGSFTCSGSPPTRSDWVWDGTVSGRFSSDGSSLTAREVWSYKFSTGDAVTVHIDWTATQN